MLAHHPGMTGSITHALAAIGGKKMQFVWWRHRPDSLADGGADGPGNPNDHLAGRQFARVGSHGLRLVLSGAVDKGFRPHVLDRLDGEAKCHTAADEAGGITGSTMTINGGQYMV